ncbi:uncharacterized protein LOC117173504 [Belonocnema kinseyi]|uniref:uncharacterized protein LOC117173504 n=1 Tax=Belonocnema kinseyi TaxID=2817044 RepID=UPI00143DB763|nr:uncharacterized protein LOC117173504 [Belonocnema kinseyi]
MKVYVGVPLLALLIYIICIELGSQYNIGLVREDYMDLPYDLGLWYSVKNNGTVYIDKLDNPNTYGLLAEDTMICVLERDGKAKIERALMAGNEQVIADGSSYTPWDDGYTILYELTFDVKLNYNTEVLEEGNKALPHDLGIWYRTKKGRADIKNGAYPSTNGLLHNDTMVCALETDDDKKIVRALFVKDKQVKVSTKSYTFWTTNDTALYELNFNHNLH